ncbi:MAG TPA: alpha/beta hydrolase [Gaiellaceae bacterium]
MTETLRIRSGGVEIHVEVDGPADGTPVVFLHGVMSSGRTWEWLPDSVTRGRRIIRIDLRGHGRSDHAAGTYDVPRYGADVVAVIRELASQQVLLVGHSLGGVVAWWVALNHPELVAAALLEDPPLLASETPDAQAGRFRTRFHAMRTAVLGYQEGGLSDEEIAERIPAIRYGPQGTPTLGELLTDDAVATSAFGYRRLDVGVIDGAIDGSTLAPTDTRSRVTVPVVIVAADDASPDVAFSLEDAERLAGWQPRVEVVRIAGSGHRIHDSRAHRDTFAKQLRRFLTVYG